jgi:hypothetical protein
MIVRQIDGSGDWLFGKGLSSYVTEDTAIRQNVRTRLLSWAGNCFWSLNDFVDWRSLLDVGKQADAMDALKSCILQTPGVIAVDSARAVFDGETRTYSLQYGIRTIFSPTFVALVNQTVGAGI